MKLNSYVIIIFTIILFNKIHAHGAFMDKSQQGYGADLEVSINKFQLNRCQIGTSYSLDGFLDAGLEFFYQPDSFRDPENLKWVDISVFTASATFSFTIIKQDNTVPFSISLPLSLKTSISVGDYLEENNLTRIGTGYKVGLKLYRFSPILPLTFLRYGLFISNKSITTVTEKNIVNEGRIQPINSIDDEFRYGLITGLSFRPNRSNRGIVFSVDLNFSFNTNMDFQFSPGLNITIIKPKERKSNV